MAEIQSIDIEGDEIFVKLKLNKSEYEVLDHHTSDLLLLPASAEALTRQLTTGKIGNSNRIMVPKRLLDEMGIYELKKKVNAQAFNINGEVYLLIKLKDIDIGVPKFEK